MMMVTGILKSKEIVMITMDRFLQALQIFQEMELTKIAQGQMQFSCLFPVDWSMEILILKRMVFPRDGQVL